MTHQFSNQVARKFLYLLLSIILLLSATSWATGPRVTPSVFVDDLMQIYAVDFPPFVSNDVAEGGLSAEIVNSVFRQVEIDAPHNILPVTNMVKYYLIDENALAVHTNYLHFSQQEKANLIHVPIALATEKFYYYKLANEAGLPWTGQLESLKGYTYGAYRGEPVDAYEKAGIKVHVGSARSLLKRLESSTVDFIRLPELTVNWILDNVHAEFRNDVIAVENSDSIVLLFVVFNSRHPEGKLMADKFKLGLDEQIKRGEYLAILSKYIPETDQQQIYMDKLNRYRAAF